MTIIAAYIRTANIQYSKCANKKISLFFLKVQEKKVHVCWVRLQMCILLELVIEIKYSVFVLSVWVLIYILVKLGQISDLFSDVTLQHCMENDRAGNMRQLKEFIAVFFCLS